MKTTKNKQPKVTLLPILAVGALLLLLTGCDQNRLDGCEEQIIVENEIPDLTMHLGDEPFRRDLIYEEPVVYRHTAGNRISITPTTADGGITVGVNIERNVEMDHLSILVVEPRNAGNTVIEIEANDECFDRRVFTSFQVTVLDTTQNNTNSNNN